MSLIILLNIMMMISFNIDLIYTYIDLVYTFI